MTNMLKEEDLNYFEKGSVENKKFWHRFGRKPDFNNKVVLDFGCGHGSLCVDIAKNNIKSIIGIDLNDELLKFANVNLKKNFSSLENKISFEKKDILKSNFDQKFDLIVSKDTFEHSENLPEILDKFYDILNNHGKVFTGFGPLYNSYNGDHGRTQLKLPWLHALLPDSFIIDRYNKYNSIKIKSIEELGLNKYSYKRYKEIFNDSKFKIEFFRTNQSDHPISKIFNFFSKFEILKEYFTYNIYCILSKN